MNTLRRNAFTAVLLAASLLSGCTVGPNYHRPSVPLPNTFAPSATATAATLGDLAWWNVFHDADLQALIRTALADNPDVKIAAARVDLVQAEFQGLRASFAPQVNARMNDTQQRISPIGLPSERTSGNPAGSATMLGLQASWEIDFWGKYRRADEAARATLLSSHAAQSAVRSSLVAAVADSYFHLLELDQQAGYAKQLLALSKERLALINARMQQGVSSLPDVQLAQIEMQQQQQNLSEVQQEIIDRESEIHALLGKTSGSIQRSTSLAQETLPDLGPGVPSSLLERRPDIQEAEQNLISANAEIGIVKASYFPNIGITAVGGVESTAFSQLFSSNAETWLLQPQINLPIFTGGRIHAQVLQADAQRDIALHQYVGTVQAAFRDVAQALAYRSTADQIDLQQNQIVGAAEHTTYLAEQQRNHGVVSSLAVIQAEETSIKAQSNDATDRCAQLDAVVHLYQSLGGGWRP